MPEPLRSTAGQVAINSVLPADMTDHARVLDRVGAKKLFQELADRHPDDYRRVSHQLLKLGGEVGYLSGGFSFGLRSRLPGPAWEVARARIRAKTDEIMRRPDLSDKAKSDMVVKMVAAEHEILPKKVMDEAVAAGNPLALQVQSGSRGNMMNLKSLLAADGLYQDHRDRVIPVPVNHSYSAGLSPAEYFAGTFGSRRGLIETKFSTQRAGYFCLAAGTMVRMADCSTKAIEDVAVGNLVVGVNAFGMSVGPVPVTNVYRHGTQPCRTYTFTEIHRDRTRLPVAELTSTPNHKVLRDCNDREELQDTARGSAYAAVPIGSWNGGYAIWLDPGYVVTSRPASCMEYRFECNDSVVLDGDQDAGKLETFDLEVDHPDHLFLLANGLVVSNSKQLTQAAHRSVVSAADASPEDDAAHRTRGMPVDADDPDNEGALLSYPAAGYPRDTVLTPRVIRDLKEKGVSRIVVRSPITGGAPDGGLYAKDVGVREHGRLPGRGENVGVVAAQSLGEPISQGSLSSKHCLFSETLVRMADMTVRRIREIRPGDTVLGASTSGKAFPVKVVRVYDNGLRDCVRTSFAVASTRERVELVSTADHKVLGTARYWDPRTELAVDGVHPVGVKCVRFAAKMMTDVQYDGEPGDPYALLLGLLLGDGCYTESVHGVHLSCFDPSLPPELTEYLAGFGLKMHLLAGQKGYYRISQIHDKVSHCPETGRWLSGLRNPILCKLHELDMHGKYAHEKSIPDCVWKWNAEAVSFLLSGLFVTDGSVYVNESCREVGSVYVGFGSTSLEMVRQIRDLLSTRFAVHPSPISTQRCKRKRPLHSFDITRRPDVLRFLKFVPLYGRKKALAARMLADWKPRWDRDTCNFYRKEQVPFGMTTTCDLEVDHPDHLFVLANGLIVSNSGGVVGAAKSVSGFRHLDALVQVPKTFPSGAAHAQADGRVEGISDAPGGGKNVRVGGLDHYVQRGFDVRVRPGDEVEAGDVLSDGIPNPAEVVKHKGVGEGRRYFAHAFREAMRDSGLTVDRRNVEILARGLINHVELDGETDEHVPGDVVTYDGLERSYRPRPGHDLLAPGRAKGMYLERPVLHYTVGTKVRPSVARELENFGVKEVVAHKDPPPFHPVMVRGMENLSHDHDWMTKMLGSNLRKNFLADVHHGSYADTLGTSYVPALALDPTGFGRRGVLAGDDGPSPGKGVLGD